MNLLQYCSIIHASSPSFTLCRVVWISHRYAAENRVSHHTVRLFGCMHRRAKMNSLREFIARASSAASRARRTW